MLYIGGVNSNIRTYEEMKQLLEQRKAGVTSLMVALLLNGEMCYGN
jgi:hypothetical protein